MAQLPVIATIEEPRTWEACNTCSHKNPPMIPERCAPYAGSGDKILRALDGVVYCGEWKSGIPISTQKP